MLLGAVAMDGVDGVSGTVGLGMLTAFSGGAMVLQMFSTAGAVRGVCKSGLQRDFCPCWSLGICNCYGRCCDLCSGFPLISTSFVCSVSP